MDPTTLLIDVVLVLFVFGMVMQIAPLLLWIERKGSAVLQDRIGANQSVYRTFLFSKDASGNFLSMSVSSTP